MTERWPLRRYRFTQPAGSDELATGHLAVDPEDGAAVLVRLAQPGAQPAPTAASRAAAERTLEWSEPSAARVRELGFDGGHPYVVCDLPAGRPLSALLGLRINLPSAAALLAPILRAAGSAIAAGVPHPGLSPERIIIDDFGTAILIDSGFVASTAAEMALGRHVLPPDLAPGEAATAAAQVYAGAALLLWLVSGEPPFAGATRGEALRKHRSRVPAALTRFVADAPAPVVDAIARSLRKAPEGRPSTLEELARAILPEAPATRPARRAWWRRLLGSRAA